MRLVGIDYGSRRIGIALSDKAGEFAFPHSTIPNDETSIDRIQKVVKDEGVGTVVFGDTRAEGGAANAITQEAETFADRLSAYAKIPVERSREAWSSFEASRYAPKGHERDDAASAAIILQRFLDVHNNHKDNGGR